MIETRSKIIHIQHALIVLRPLNTSLLLDTCITTLWQIVGKTTSKGLDTITFDTCHNANDWNKEKLITRNHKHSYQIRF